VVNDKGEVVAVVEVVVEVEVGVDHEVGAEDEEERTDSLRCPILKMAMRNGMILISGSFQSHP